MTDQPDEHSVQPPQYIWTIVILSAGREMIEGESERERERGREGGWKERGGEER